MRLTDTAKLYPKPSRMSWRDTAASNLWGLVAVILIVLLAVGAVGVWQWAMWALEWIGRIV